MPTFCACGCGERVSHSGCFRKGHNPAGVCDPDGKLKAINAMNNPVNNRKRQERAREEAVARIAKMPKCAEEILTFDAAKETAEEIMVSVGDNWDTHGAAVEEFLLLDGSNYYPDKRMAVYVGYTARCLKDEALSWLSKRGCNRQLPDGNYINSGQLNRPVLLWSDGSGITGTEAQTKVGFRFVEVYSSTLMINARYVEKALQERYQHLPLGQRLWRCPDKGKKYDKEIDGKLHKVFLTFSPNVGQMLAEGQIKVNF